MWLCILSNFPFLDLFSRNVSFFTSAKTMSERQVYVPTILNHAQKIKACFIIFVFSAHVIKNNSSTCRKDKKPAAAKRFSLFLRQKNCFLRRSAFLISPFFSIAKAQIIRFLWKFSGFYANYPYSHHCFFTIFALTAQATKNMIILYLYYLSFIFNAKRFASFSGESAHGNH